MPGPGLVVAATMTQKTWFITGTSRGFGREWTEAALDRGDRVAATARDISTLDDLVEKYGEAILPLQLDVTNREADFAAVENAHRTFGRLDVVVNNAGYGHFGFVEELTEDEVRAQMETNLFGALWVTQAALPILRSQGSGHIIQVSSIGGISAFPGIGAYHASKWALEGLSQALAAEVAGFGVKVTLVEPGGFATDWAGPSSKRSESLPAYAEARETMERERRARAGAGGPGDPRASAAALLRIVDSPEPPLRVFFGNTPIDIAKADYARRIQTWEQWDGVAKLAQG
jgi:NAD(P)-dependent dehydrogenase (short-subunit alcohol dehydrogenase family)